MMNSRIGIAVLAIVSALVWTPVAHGDGANGGDGPRRPSLKDGGRSAHAPVARGSYAAGATETVPRVLGFYGDQRGCYWRRGERICSRYCYWEADGYRYCVEKERRAFPQGDPWFVAHPPEPPIYLRPPFARP